ncbi:MAG: DUF1643 domain-containing protein [Melioribacteraceae bacterium]
MRKPVYRHPSFVTKVEAKKTSTKRYWLTLEIDKTKSEKIIVILKNPSRATKDISDKTVFNVTSYIYKNSKTNKLLKNVGTIVILNLIPNYETYSEKLQHLENSILDKKNLKTIDDFSSKNSLVIIAWGNPPKGLKQEYNEIRDSTIEILKRNKNKIFYIHKLSALGNPKHGQIWAYKNEMKKYI